MPKRKPVNMHTLKLMKSMNLNTANRWVEDLYHTAWNDGVEAAERTMDDMLEYNPDTFRAFLLTIPGIGDKIADRIVQAVLEADRQPHAEVVVEYEGVDA